MDSVGLTVGILINLSDTSAGRVPRLSHSSRYSMYFLNGADLLAPERALTMRTVNPTAVSRPQMVRRSCSASMGAGLMRPHIGPAPLTEIAITTPILPAIDTGV